MVINIASRFYSILIGYLVVVFVNRYYSFEEYGEYIMFIVYCSILTVFGVFGVNKSVISETRFDLENNNLFKLKILALNVIFSLFFVTLICFIFNISYCAELLIVVTFMVVNEIIKGLFLLHQSNKIFSFLTYIVEPSVFGLFLSYSIFFDKKIELIKMTIYSHTFLVVLGLVLAFYTRILSLKNYSSQKVSILDFYKVSITFFLINISQVIIDSVDKILISKFLNNKFVGIYSTLDKISRLTTAMFNAMSPLLMKKIARFKESNILLKVYENYSSIAILISLPSSFSIYFFRNEILPLFNSSLIQYEFILLGLLIVKLIQYSSGFKAVMLQMSGLKKYDLFSKLIKLITNTIFIYICIGLLKYDLLGVVLALLISMLLFTQAQVYFIKIKYEVTYLQPIFYITFLYQSVCYLSGYYLGEYVFVLFQIIYFSLAIRHSKSLLGIDYE